MEEEGRSVEEAPKSAFPIIDSSSIVTIIWNPENKEFSCIFCKRFTIDELNLGPLYRLPEDGVVTHYFCLLFSAGLVQHGDDRQGILGFLPEDIKKESRRAQRLKCTYCGINGASIGCNTSRCKVSFHFPCGLANEANLQFLRNYQAFCKNHSDLEEIDIPLSDRECPICLSLVEPPERPIKGPCCKTAIFHKECLQRLALNAGYFFKCPTCNSLKHFGDSTKRQGIFVPEQDASWEREPHAYQDLYQSYNHCDAVACECPKGRDFGANKGSWLLARCRICGSAGTHRLCGKLNTIANWACAFCLEVEARTPKEPKLSIKSIKIEPSELSTSSTDGPSSSAKTSGKNKKVATASSSNQKSKGGLLQTVEPPSSSKTTKNKLKTETTPVRIKRTGRPADAFDSEDDDDVDLSKIQIQPSCREYFPHSRDTKRKFAESEGILPDWRSYFLKVYLVDVFLDAIEGSEEFLPDNAIKPKSVTDVPSKDDKIAPSKHKVSDKSKLIQKTPKQGKSRKRSSRGTNWSKGLVKRKKKPTTSKSKRNQDPVFPESNESLVKQNGGDEAIPAQTSASQAVLVGIRRSQESLLQLKANTSNKVDDDRNTLTERNKDGGGMSVNAESVCVEKDQGPDRETVSCSKNSSIAAEAVKGQQNTNDSVPVLAKKFSESDLKNSTAQVIGNGICNNDGTSTLSIQSSESSSSVNNGSHPLATSGRSDKPVVKVEVEQQQQDDDNSVSQNEPSSSNPSLVLELRESAHGIARDLLNMNNEEANAQLRILERKCPQLFRDNNTNNHTNNDDDNSNNA